MHAHVDRVNIHKEVKELSENYFSSFIGKECRNLSPDLMVFISKVFFRLSKYIAGFYNEFVK